jgi:hypothetical protein
MVSFRARQALTLIAALLALATHAGAPGAAAAPADAGRERHDRLLDQIQEIVSRDGPYSPALLEPLTALIVLYQEGEDDALAVVAIERARQVVRVNQGLHTLDQVPLIRQLIRIEEARGNHGEAWDLEQDLLTLARRYPDDLRTVPVLREVADRQMDVLADYLAGKRPPQLYLGCYYGGDCTGGSRRYVMHGMLADAQRNYSDAIAVLLRHELYDSDELRELEMELLRGVDLAHAAYGSGPTRSALFLPPLVELAGWDSSHLSGLSPRPEEIRRREMKYDNTYNRGRQILQRLYAYDVATAQPALTQATAAVQIADWDLLYAGNGRAVDAYEFAYAALQKAGIEQASIDALFAPKLPVVLPPSQPNPLARDETADAAGHIDVGFSITKYGDGRDIHILDAANASPDEQERLVTLIARSRFRPRTTSGRFDDASRVVVRYHVYD